MKRAWKVSWYNEDDYGWMDHISVVVHGDEMDEVQAHKTVVEKLNECYKNTDFLDRYEHLEILEVTRNEILYIHMSASGL